MYLVMHLEQQAYTRYLDEHGHALLALPAQRAIVRTAPGEDLAGLRVHGVVDAAACDAHHLLVSQRVHGARVLDRQVLVPLRAVCELAAVPAAEGQHLPVGPQVPKGRKVEGWGRVVCKGEIVKAST